MEIYMVLPSAASPTLRIGGHLEGELYGA